MLKAPAVQFCIELQTKERMDRIKLEHRARILKQYGKKTRFVSNTDVLNYLLDNFGRR